VGNFDVKSGGTVVKLTCIAGI